MAKRFSNAIDIWFPFVHTEMLLSNCRICSNNIIGELFTFLSNRNETQHTSTLCARTCMFVVRSLHFCIGVCMFGLVTDLVLLWCCIFGSNRASHMFLFSSFRSVLSNHVASISISVSFGRSFNLKWSEIYFDRNFIGFRSNFISISTRSYFWFPFIQTKCERETTKKINQPKKVIIWNLSKQLFLSELDPF